MRTSHASLFLACVLTFGCQPGEPIPNDPGAAGGKADGYQKFPSSTDVLPDDYNGPRFELSQSYPTELPQVDLSTLPWRSVDFRTDPDAFMLAIRDYFYRGLGVVDETGALVNEGAGPTDFNDAGSRGFYGMPWLHTTNKRREGIHGFTRENDAPVGRFGEGQTELVQNWGTAYYNALGGYSIGKVFVGSKKADLRNNNAQFPEGTAVVKMLFTAASTEELPWLEGAFAWQANINSADADDKSPRTIRTVRLLQMDVAVKDSRASETGWVFGTFVFDPDADPVLAGGTDGFHRMMPVGVVWGNDPGVTPDDIASGAKTLAESVNSPHISALAQKTLGWGGRLNGPADNPASACMSCHSTAEYRNAPSFTPRPTEDPLRYFRNLSGAEPFDEGRIALDYSQQLTAALRNLTIAGGLVVKE